MLVLIILVLVGVFGREFRVIQGRGELAAIKTTLGALRTAFVIDHISQVAQGKSDAPPQSNPFKLLSHEPANYAGLLSSLKGQPIPPGNWVFDAYCNCIGYEPLYPRSLDHAGEVPTVWFRISPPPAPLQISPMETYVWQGESIN